MGRQIIKQPNGKYSIYSSITESIIVYNATKKEIINFYKEEVIEQLNKIESSKKPYYQFTLTWDEVKNTIPK